jgi:Uma2 family endonuclease
VSSIIEPKKMTLATLHLEDHLPATLTAPGLSEAEFLALAEDFPDCFLEYTAEGTVLIMPPTDPASSKRVNEVAYQLTSWAKKDGRGVVFGPDGGFFLSDGSRLSPDATWCDKQRWEEAQQPGTVFPVFAPEFVIEVRSPKQRLRPLREKMDEYVANGVELGWLIDPIEHTVEIYRQGSAPELLSNPKAVSGEGPVAGFVLDLTGIL